MYTMQKIKMYIIITSQEPAIRHWIHVVLVLPVLGVNSMQYCIVCSVNSMQWLYCFFVGHFFNAIWLTGDCIKSMQFVRQKGNYCNWRVFFLHFFFYIFLNSKNKTLYHGIEKKKMLYFFNHKINAMIVLKLFEIVLKF